MEEAIKINIFTIENKIKLQNLFNTIYARAEKLAAGVIGNECESCVRTLCDIYDRIEGTETGILQDILEQNHEDDECDGDCEEDEEDCNCKKENKKLN